MASSKKNKYLLALGAFALLAFGTNKVVKNVNSKILLGTPRIRFGKFSGFNIPVELVIPLINQNNLDIPYQGCDLTLYYGNDAIGKVVDANGQTITANSTTEVKISVRVGVFAAAQAIQDAITTGTYTQSLSTKGTLRISGISFPYSQTLKVF